MQKNLLYIECGITMRTTINTGIQRVVRSIIGEAKKVGPKMGCEIVLVDFSGDGFNIVGKIRPSINGVINNFLIRVAQAFDRRLFRFRKFDIFIRIEVSVKFWVKSNLLNKKSKLSELKPIDVSGNASILLLLDSNWDNSIWPEIDRFRQSGGKVCAILYDLIPFTHPDTVADLTRLAHTRWWREAPKHIDSVMCISNSVRNEFLEWQKQMRFCSPIPDGNVGYFHLGAELATTDPIITLLYKSCPFYLMVGSLEPRKNHKLVLDAFDQLWKEGMSIRLAIVGAYGWKSEELLSRVQGHPLFNVNLFLIRDATDRDLAALYSSTEALIIASKAEGFGLPIIEAQQFNCKVICSDIPVFREVAAGQDVTFFNLHKLQALVDAIARHANRKNCPAESSKRLNLISWRQSAEQLLSQVKKIERINI